MKFAEPSHRHTCSVCQTCAPWGPAWRWFGSWRDIDGGIPVLKFCSDACNARAIEQGLVPKDGGNVCATKKTRKHGSAHLTPAAEPSGTFFRGGEL